MATWAGGVFCTIVVPGERTPNGTVDHLSHRPTLENHFDRRRLACQKVASAQLAGFESCLAPQAGRLWALGGEGVAGVKANNKLGGRTVFAARSTGAVWSGRIIFRAGQQLS